MSATFHVADSEVFSDEMKGIILSENSIMKKSNVATPLATEPEPRTHTVENLYCVFPETCFCARRPESNNLFSWAQPADFCGCFSPDPNGEIEGRILLGGDSMSIVCEAAQPPGCRQQFSV